MTALWTASFYILLLNVLRKCIHGEISLYQSFYWRDLILCINNIDMLSMCMKKCHAKKINFWQSDCLSTFAILFGLGILDSSFLYWRLLWWWWCVCVCVGGGAWYLISIAYCPFFHLIMFFSMNFPSTSTKKSVFEYVMNITGFDCGVARLKKKRRRKYLYTILENQYFQYPKIIFNIPFPKIPGIPYP